MGLRDIEFVSQDPLRNAAFVDQPLEAFGARGDIHNGQNLTQREEDCKRIIHIPLSRVESRGCGRLPSKQMSALQNFQEHVRAYMAENEMTQAALAESVGVSEAWLSQVLSGKRGSRIQTLERVAEKMGKRGLSELFGPATTTNGPGKKTKKGVDLPPTPSEGAPYGVEADLFRQLTELQANHETLRRAVKGTVKRLGELVGEQAPPTTGRESGARTTDRKSHRRLSTARQLKPKSAQ